MLNRKICKCIIAGCFVFVVGLIFAGCDSSKSADCSSFKLADCNAFKQGVKAGVAREESEGGSQLWAENCGRCHNLRSPSSYSDTQWEVAVHHMRVRADLTPVEQKKILEFLQSAN